MKRGEKWWMAFAVLTIGGISTFSILYGISTQRRNAALAKITVPEDRGRRMEHALLNVYTSAAMRPLSNFDESTLLETVARLQSLWALPYYEARDEILQLEQEVESRHGYTTGDIVWRGVSEQR